MQPSIRKKLIEVSIPLEAINKASKKQKAPKGYPTAIHKYWAQRPIAACRGVLFAQLVDDPSSWPDRFRTEKEQDAERERLHKVLADLVPWEASNDESILNAARWEIARSVAWGLGEEPPPQGHTQAILDYLQTKGPPVYDPFSGGGSIPLEAQRLGLRAYGSDLNPLAVLIGKALVEIPPRFAGQPPVNPKAQAELKRGHWNGKGAQGLAEDVRYYGQSMRDEAEKRIGHLYPKVTLPGGSEATVIAWLWARTVRSPDPVARSAMVPLVSSFMLSTKAGRKAWAVPIIDPNATDGWRFEVRTGGLSKEDEAKLKQGTVGRASGGTCILTGSPMPFSYIREQAKTSGLGVRLLAIVAEADRGRIYLTPTKDQESLAQTAEPSWEPNTPLPDRALGFRVQEYGMHEWADLFTKRQLAALATFSGLVTEVRARVLSDAIDAGRQIESASLEKGGNGAAAYADAVATYLAFTVSRAADYGSAQATWLTDDNAIRGTFGRQALPMTWDFCEGNFFGDSSAALSTILKTIPSVIEHQEATGLAEIYQVDAARNGFPQRPCVINTDPPYYDNIGYADLSDFFYVWLRRALSSVWPELFRRLATPKLEELIATPFRHDNRNQAEAFFMEGMGRALTAMGGASVNSEPLAIYYAFKQSEIAQDGVTSAGWSSFLQAVVDAELMIDGTWPLRTESAGRLIGRGTNALASSIVLVCRKRPTNAETITKADFIRLLKREMPEAIDDIRKAGVGPVDMQQSVIGPGMGVFSRHARVLQDDDSTMSVKTALAVINRVWGEIENEADAALDAETQVALAWFNSYGFDAKSSGELITLANAKNVPQQALFASGVFTDLRGRAQLTPRDQLPPEWTPEGDKSLTVWECVQHAARTLRAEDGGQEAAARLVAQMPAQLRADARLLSDRLFQISTDKGWSQEALAYNELSTEWHGLTERAQSIAEAAQTGPVQATFDLGGAA